MIHREGIDARVDVPQYPGLRTSCFISRLDECSSRRLQSVSRRRLGGNISARESVTGNGADACRQARLLTRLKVWMAKPLWRDARSMYRMYSPRHGTDAAGESRVRGGWLPREAGDVNRR